MSREAEGRRVLACASERHICRLIEVSLQRQGHDVCTVLNVADALAALETSDFSLVVVDRNLDSLAQLIDLAGGKGVPITFFN